MPSTGYKWLDVLLFLFVFLVVVWALLQFGEMIFDDEGDLDARILPFYHAAVGTMDGGGRCAYLHC